MSDEQNETNEMATGGVIETSGIAIVGGDTGPETVHAFGQPVPLEPGQWHTLNITNVAANPTALNSAGAGYCAQPLIAGWNPALSATAPQFIPGWNAGAQMPLSYPISIPPAQTSGTLDLTPYGEEMLREMVAEHVKHALYPESTISTHQHRRVEMVEETGKRWRGVLYAVEDEELGTHRSYALKARHEPGPSGVCWVCGKPGEDMSTFVRGPGRTNELIHRTEECISGAYRKDRAESL